jgi:hypothetical protein
VYKASGYDDLIRAAASKSLDSPSNSYFPADFLTVVESTEVKENQEHPRISPVLEETRCSSPRRHDQMLLIIILGAALGAGARGK